MKSIPVVNSARSAALSQPGEAAKLSAVTLTRRSLALALCVTASGCFGGPTSDWPNRSNNDDDRGSDRPGDPGAPENIGGLDAGTSSSLDGGIGTSFDVPPCVSTTTDEAGVPDAGMAEIGAQPMSEVSDAGCR